MSTTFSKQGAEKLRKVVDRVLKTPYARNQERTHTPPTETSFWAMLTGTADMSALRYNFVRVNPVASKDRADFTIGEQLPLFYEIAGDQVEEGYAREANGLKTIPSMTVVQLTFIGYDADDLPAYLFTWANTTIDAGLPPHDHRSNLDGGLAFSIFHPGTGLPQTPFAI